MAEIRSGGGEKGHGADSGLEQTAQGSLGAGLYIVATPIGNLGDITARAIDTLKNVDVIACEDTRVTAKLLNAFLIKKPMIPYHEHNGTVQRPKIEKLISDGKAVALVSDAGTPLISDPGFKLVSDLAAKGYPVTTLPGASAVTAALTLAGLPTNRFLFMGFAPHKSKARRDWFDREKNTNATLVFYESARRLKDCLVDASEVLGDRQIAVCREISKRFEEVVRGNISDLAARYDKEGAPKGEVVVVLEAAKAAANKGSTIDTDKVLKTALNHMSVKSAATFVAEITGERRKELYNKALQLNANARRED